LPFSPTLIVITADILVVLGYRVKRSMFLVRLSLVFLPKLTHPAARFVCDSWLTCIYATRRSVNGSLRHGPWLGAREVMLQYKRRCCLRAACGGRLEMTTHHIVPPSLQDIAAARMIKILSFSQNTLYCIANGYISRSGSFLSY